MTYAERAQKIFQEEIDELAQVARRIGGEFDRAVELIYGCSGKLVIIGVGKTGLIGRKIAASLASTGTPSIFVHAAEAHHGDLGMVSPDDIVMLISNSGSSAEVVGLIDPLKRIGCRLIALTGNLQSPLAKGVQTVIDTGVRREACPLGLAPTSSTTATLVMGDALTVCLMERRGFKADHFALYHPGGALGRKLLGKVKDCMSRDIPRVEEDTAFEEVIYQVSSKRLGMTLVYNREGLPTGIITDGDIRRAFQHHRQVQRLKAADLMTPHFKRITGEQLQTEALQMMDTHRITTLPVMEHEGSQRVVGIISIHHIIDFEK